MPTKPYIVEIFWPYELESGETDIVIDGTVVALNTGTYYTTYDSPHGDSLLGHVVDRIESETSHLADWTKAKPDGRIHWKGSTTLDPGDANWTLPAPLIGWKPSTTTIDPLDAAPWMQQNRLILPAPTSDDLDTFAGYDFGLRNWRGFPTRDFVQQDKGQGAEGGPLDEIDRMRLRTYNTPAGLVYDARATTSSGIDDLWSDPSQHVGNDHFTVETYFRNAFRWAGIDQQNGSLVVHVRYRGKQDVAWKGRFADIAGRLMDLFEDESGSSGERYTVSIDLEVTDQKDADNIEDAPLLATGSADNEVHLSNAFDDPSDSSFERWSYTNHAGTVHGIAVDPAGNVYTASNDDEVHKIDIEGNQVWTYTGHTDNARAVAVDTSGNVYSGALDNSVHKLDSTGTKVWEYNTSSGVFTVVVDDNGNTYIGTGSGNVHKVDSTGNQVWFYDTGQSFFNTFALAVDDQGNVYLGYGGSPEVEKLDSTGTKVWDYALGNSCLGLDVDPDGFVYAAGLNNEVHKVDADGNNVWQYAYTERFFGTAVDQNGYVYSGADDGTLHKIDPDGNEVWVAQSHTSTIRAVDGTPGRFGAFPDKW